MDSKLIRKTVLAVLLIFGSLPGVAGRENTPISVNIIIDGSRAFGTVANGVSAWFSGFLLNSVLKDGDRLSIQSVQNSEGDVKTLYSGIYRSHDKNIILQALENLPAQDAGEFPDFTPALRQAARTGGISYTLLICASPSSLSQTLEGPGAAMLRYSRVEEFKGWSIITVSLNINDRVSRVAAAWFAGN